MNTFFSRIALTLVLLLGIAGSVVAQTTTTTTTISAAIPDTTTRTITVASATNIDAGGQLYIAPELMRVVSVSGTTVQVERGISGTRPAPHMANEQVYVAARASVSNVFRSYDKAGACTSTNEAFLPQINYLSGDIQSCNCVLRYTSGSIGQCQFQVWGGFQSAPLTMPSLSVNIISDVNYTILPSDEVVVFNSLSAARTVTIGAMSVPGKVLILINGNTNRTQTISGLINTNGTYTLAPNAALRLVWTGQEWYQF